MKDRSERCSSPASEPDQRSDGDTNQAAAAGLVALSVAVLMVGLGLLYSRPLAGIAVVGAAVVLVLWARIAQANALHRQVINELRRLNTPRETVTEADQADRAAEVNSERAWGSDAGEGPV